MPGDDKELAAPAADLPVVPPGLDVRIADSGVTVVVERRHRRGDGLDDVPRVARGNAHRHSFFCHSSYLGPFTLMPSAAGRRKRATPSAVCASPSIYNRSCILIYALVCMRRSS